MREWKLYIYLITNYLKRYAYTDSSSLPMFKSQNYIKKDKSRYKQSSGVGWNLNEWGQHHPECKFTHSKNIKIEAMIYLVKLQIIRPDQKPRNACHWVS